MNQHQRKFLLEQIEGIYKTEKQALNDRRPKAPSLNNYLIAAILDGSARLRSQEEIAGDIRKRVRDLGKSEGLVTASSSRRWGRGSSDEDDEDEISLPALTLYVAPPDYAEARAAFDTAEAAWEAEKEALEASINAMRIKVQVGSDKSLEALVNQADNLCTMSLSASSKLLLPAKSL